MTFGRDVIVRGAAELDETEPVRLADGTVVGDG